MLNNQTLSRLVILFLCSLLVAACDQGTAGQTKNVGQVLCTIKESSFRGVGNLLVVFAYVSGIGLLIAAVFKLKQVKDNPTQIPVSTPAALFLCGTLSMFLPSIFMPAGASVFGQGAKSGERVAPSDDENVVSTIPNFISSS